METIITEHCGIRWALDYTTDHHCADLIAVRPNDEDEDFIPFLRPDLVSLFQNLAEQDVFSRAIDAADAALALRKETEVCHD